MAPDRTNRKVGVIDIKILMLSIVYRGIGGDRKFVGKSWFRMHGGINGFSTVLVGFPEEQVTMVALRNAADGLPGPERIGQDLAAIIFGEKYKIPRGKVVVRIDPNIYDAYAGEYQVGLSLTLKITREGDKLMGGPVEEPQAAVSQVENRPKEQIMNLAIFDIDGTLTNTNLIDEKCFLKAFSTSFSITGIDLDWTRYPSVTDSGIMGQIFQERFGRGPDQVEIETLKRCFVGLLEECHRADTAAFAEVPGAAVLLNHLAEESLWAVAIATGGWRESACFKLKAAMIEIDRFPAASANDGRMREDIVRTAVARALDRYEQTQFERIVSIGDGVWDVITAARLGIPFLGIGQGSQAHRLREAGASHILEDYGDYHQFTQYLKEAEIPDSRGI